jgi:hypothetical protein
MKRIKTISVLFIGNSFSYYHNLPRLIARFAIASGSGNFVVDGVFRGGATLKELWHDGRALKKIQDKNWDYVVLQERGRLGGVVKNGIVHVGNPQTFYAYATRFDKAIKKSGAKTILYCPPSFFGTGLTEDAEKLHAAYMKLAHRLGAIMIPSIPAFMLTTRKRPDINLYERDGQHPSPMGAYLIACLFCKKILRVKNLNLPLRSYSSRSKEFRKNSNHAVKISKSDAHFFWSIANQIK